MPEPPVQRITELLVAWRDGDAGALERLTPLVYPDLCRLAHQKMRGERPGHLLQTTAVVSETYLRLLRCRRVGWQNRTQFFALCAHLMRRILVDAARANRARKRQRVPGLSVALRAAPRAPEVDVLALDEALVQLGALNARQARVVELRYFGGMTVAETAEALQVSVQTVVRDWNFAKLWLLRALRSGADEAQGTSHEQ